MKKLITPAALIIMLLINLSAIAQCSISGSNTSPGLTPNNVPCITPNVAYGQTQQIYIPPTGPGGITVDSAVFTGITGLPSGITYTINPANGRFLGGSNGCIWFSGTTTVTSGTFPLTITGSIYTSGGTFPISALIGDTASICVTGCTINTSNTSPGLTPATLPCITPNVAYGQTQQIYIPATGPGGITVDSAVFTGLTGLPSGITYSLNPSNGRFTGGSWGCVWVSGTTTVTSGTFPLTITGSIYTSGGTFPISALIGDTVSICGGSPVAGFSASPTTVCTNSNVSFTNTTTGTANGYTWLFPGGNPSSSNQQTPPSVSYPGGGNYTVTLIAYGSSGNDTLVRTNYISVYNNPSVQVNVTPSTCGNSVGTAIAVVSGASGPFTYAWSPSGSTDTISGLPVGSYTVTVSAQAGCSATATNNVVNSNGPSITFSNTEPTCYMNNNGQIIANVTGGAAPYAYAWAGLVSTSDTLTGLASATYYLTVTDHSGCLGIASDSLSQPIFVSDYISTVNATGTPNGRAWANPSGGTAPYTYLWSPGGATTDTITGLVPGIYTITVTDNHGCTDTRQGTVGGTIGINEVTTLIYNVSVAPNPSRDEMTVSVSMAAAAAMEIKLYDIEGKAVYSDMEANGQSRVQKKINVQAFTSGIYILEVRANGESMRTRVSIAH
jgi:PKD repeat protein